MTSQNTSDPLFAHSCLFSKTSLYILSSYTLVRTLLLVPLHFLVLRTGFQRWRTNRRYTVSHTDFFTYHSVPFELLVYSGYMVWTYAVLKYDYYLLMCAFRMMIFASPGVLSAHILTCLERYVAVVYPVVYLTLRKQQPARNLTILGIWLICLLWFILFNYIELQNQYILLFTVVGTAFIIISFCSFEVLRALRNPAPGEGKGVGQSKRRAFCTMLTILSVLVFWLASGIVCSVLEKMHVLGSELMCSLQSSTCWFQFLSSLVLPLLFLNRAWKTPRPDKV
ncbi:hypothetical protein NL108_018081 [Boleophthalmus pectinirostris]|nr:hypothetical protein NL108_018081 [Boleophthalmus pectinirostris]